MASNDPFSLQGTTANTPAALNLRPLPLGELLDRAFNIYFRNIISFTALLGVVLVPSLLISYFNSKDILDFYLTTIQHQILSPSSQPDISKLAALKPSDTGTALQIVVGVLALPLANAAVISGVGRAYLGLPISLAACYREAARRWLAILILMVLWFVAAIVAVIASVFIFGLAIGVLAALAALLPKNMLVVGAMAFFGILLGLASIAMAILLYLTGAFSFIAVVLENADPIRAFGSAFTRIFGSHQFWRSVALALALTGISLGTYMVAGGGGGVLAFIFKSPALYMIFAGLAQLFFVPFALIASAVFYYDIRIRREGYDLQMLADRFSAALPPVAPTA